MDVPLDSRALAYFRSGIQNGNIMMSRDDFGGKWRFTAPGKCKRVGMGHVYALAKMEENTDIVMGIVEVDTIFQRLRFLEMYQDNMLYSNLIKIDESRYDTSWQVSDDPSAPVNRYSSFLKEHYEEIPET